MPRISNRRSAGARFVVPGLYAALLENERAACAKIDPRTIPRLNPESSGPRTVVETGARSTVLLAELEAGRPVRRQGRQLRGHSLLPASTTAS